MFLKQSAAVDVVVGPFVDDTDGKTAETGLTISQADCQLSKNGGAVAQKNSATAASHLGGGHYKVPLNSTDTNTLGVLRLYVNESGALPVWADYMVMTANAWDSLFGTDKFDVNVEEWNATSVPAENTAGYPIVTIKDGTGTGEIDTASGKVLLQDNAVTAAVIASGAITNAKFTAGAIDAAALAADAGAEIADAVWDEALSGHTTAGSAGKKLGDQSSSDPWATALPGSYGAGTAGKILGDKAFNANQIGGSATAATNAARGYQGLVLGKAVTGTLTATAFTTDLTEATNDHYNGRSLVFTSGALAGQQTTITDYTGATKLVTVAAMTEAPANNDEFYIA